MLEPNALKSSFDYGVGCRKGELTNIWTFSPRNSAVDESYLLPAGLTEPPSIHPTHVAHTDDTNRNTVHYGDGNSVCLDASCAGNFQGFVDRRWTLCKAGNRIIISLSRETRWLIT
jgi:hypothetical protein